MGRVCMCVSMCVFTTCVPGAHGDQKMMLEMKLQPLGCLGWSPGPLLLSSTKWALAPVSTTAHDPYEYTEDNNILQHKRGSRQQRQASLLYREFQASQSDIEKPCLQKQRV